MEYRIVATSISLVSLHFSFNPTPLYNKGVNSFTFLGAQYLSTNYNKYFSLRMSMHGLVTNYLTLFRHHYIPLFGVNSHFCQRISWRKYHQNISNTLALEGVWNNSKLIISSLHLSFILPLLYKGDNSFAFSCRCISWRKYFDTSNGIVALAVPSFFLHSYPVSIRVSTHIFAGALVEEIINNTLHLAGVWNSSKLYLAVASLFLPLYKCGNSFAFCAGTLVKEIKKISSN